MRPVDYAAMTERRCSSCKETKPVSEFGKYDDPKQPINGWRYYSRCRSCSNAACRNYGAGNRPQRNARLRQWRKDNPAAARALDRRRKLKALYDLTPEDVEAMFEEQGGRCLTCGEVKKLVVDHDHETGQVRGGLCASCNSFLGRVEANPAILQAMAAYLWPPCHADVLLEHANVSPAAATLETRPRTKETP